VNKWAISIAFALGSCAPADQRQPASPIATTPAASLADSGPGRDAATPVEPDAGAHHPSSSPAIRLGDADFSARAAVPAAFRPDGALDEWGRLVSNDTGATSHLAAALTPRELVLAADLDGSMAGGVWLEARFPFNELPHIGTYGYSGGLINPFQCEVHPLTRRPLGGAEKAACKRKLTTILPEQEQLASRYEARFRRTFRIDANGIRVLDGPAGLRPVAGASSGFVQRGGRVHLEALIPALALPAASEAPVSSMLFALSAQPESAAPSTRAEELAHLQLPAPVDFAPFGEARAQLLIANNPGVRCVYQPGEGLPLEVFRYRDRWMFDDNPPDLTMTIVARPQLLYSPAIKLGRVELAYGFEERMAVVVFVDGVFKDLISTQGTTRNIVQRDGRLHVITGVAYWDEASQRRTGRWEVEVVEEDGRHDSLTLPQPAPVDWISVRTYHSQDWSEFGLQGRCKLASGVQSAMTVGWRWKAERRAYELL